MRKKKREETTAKDVQLTMENLGQTKKKEKKERDESKPAKERRSTGSQMLAYLRESTDEEMTLRTKANEKLMGEGHEDLLKVK